MAHRNQLHDHGISWLPSRLTCPPRAGAGQRLRHVNLRSMQSLVAVCKVRCEGEEICITEVERVTQDAKYRGRRGCSALGSLSVSVSPFVTEFEVTLQFGRPLTGRVRVVVRCRMTSADSNARSLDRP